MSAWAPFVWVGLVGVIFVSGSRWGSNDCRRLRAEERQASINLVARIKADNLVRDGKYEEQLRAANRTHLQDVADIAAAAAKPGPSLLCKRPRSANPVPGDSAQAGNQTGGAGQPGDVHGSDIDYGPTLRGFAVSRARELEACYAALDKWPI